MRALSVSLCALFAVATFPLAAAAEHNDVIAIKLHESCSVEAYVKIKDDFNSMWGKDNGYRAEIAVPIQGTDLTTIFWKRPECVERTSVELLHRFIQHEFPVVRRAGLPPGGLSGFGKPRGLLVQRQNLRNKVHAHIATQHDTQHARLDGGLPSCSSLLSSIAHSAAPARK